ncbi:Bug family tripartite tricarboxylate transporter substrate binding protein [Advenella kashmirensis]
MNNRIRSIRFFAPVFALCAALSCGASLAESFPNHPVTFIVGYSPGGAIDQSARLLAQALSERWGQAIVVDNRPGANGTIAATAVANAKPDGYTILVTATSHNLNKFVNKNLRYDVEKSFSPVAMTVDVSNILVVNANAPYQTLDQFITAVKAAPDKFSYASQGIGGIPHLAGEMFKLKTGTRIMHVPYKGAAQGMTDLIGGVVDMSIPSTGSVMNFIQQGKLRALAIASNQRFEQLPNVPTFAESGVPDFMVSTWHGLLAPAGTPPEIVFKINADVNEIIKTEAFKNALLTQGSVAAEPLTPAQFSQRLANELKIYGEVASAINLGAQ